MPRVFSGSNPRDRLDVEEIRRSGRNIGRLINILLQGIELVAQLRLDVDVALKSSHGTRLIWRKGGVFWRRVIRLNRNGRRHAIVQHGKKGILGHGWSRIKVGRQGWTTTIGYKSRQDALVNFLQSFHVLVLDHIGWHSVERRIHQSKVHLSTTTTT